MWRRCSNGTIQVTFEEPDVRGHFIFEGENIGVFHYTKQAGSSVPVVCKNLTTGQRVVIRGVATSWDCEAAGLVVHPGNLIQQTVTGTAD